MASSLNPGPFRGLFASAHALHARADLGRAAQAASPARLFLLHIHSVCRTQHTHHPVRLITHIRRASHTTPSLAHRPQEPNVTPPHHPKMGPKLATSHMLSHVASGRFRAQCRSASETCFAFVPLPVPVPVPVPVAAAVRSHKSQKSNRTRLGSERYFEAPAHVIRRERSVESVGKCVLRSYMLYTSHVHAIAANAVVGLRRLQCTARGSDGERFRPKQSPTP